MNKTKEEKKQEKLEKFNAKKKVEISVKKKEKKKTGGYDPEETEKFWKNYWKENESFLPKSSDKKFTMVLPPPNITGSLHIGHAMMISIEDCIVRYKRLNGFETVFIPGLDHAGIATQNVVLKNMVKENKEITRKSFLEEAYSWSNKYSNRINDQLLRMGSSLDFSRSVFTMDEKVNNSVNKAFCLLYNKGLIYRENRMTSWCSKLKTSLSDLEVSFKEVKGNSFIEADGKKYKFGVLYFFKYFLKKEETSNNDFHNLPYVVVATSRPETIMGDTALCINPNDERFYNIDFSNSYDITAQCSNINIEKNDIKNTEEQFKNLNDDAAEIKLEKKNKYKFIKENTDEKEKRANFYAINPITFETIPVIIDSHADMTFGTGVLKVTPAHDPIDFKLGKKHNLKTIKILNEDNKIDLSTVFNLKNVKSEDLTLKDNNYNGAPANLSNSNNTFDTSFNDKTNKSIDINNITSTTSNKTQNDHNNNVPDSISNNIINCSTVNNQTIDLNNSFNLNFLIKINGLKRFDARKAVIEELKKNDFFIKEESYNQILPFCSRSGDIVEPSIKEQWWCDCKEMARRSIEAVKNNDIKLYPEEAKSTWYRWLENIKDWCLSRQLWWGHRIPAYLASDTNNNECNEVDSKIFNKASEWIVAETEEEAWKIARSKGYNTLKQDEDVLDTWFSSGLWPFSTLGWPENTLDFEKYFPNSLLETGSDILFFWVARMVMLSFILLDKKPFNRIFLHGIVRDAHGMKMSKSLGNVIDPLYVIEGIGLEEMINNLSLGNLDPRELKRASDALKKDYPNGIKKCGADALRFTLLSYTNGMKDINLDVLRVEGYSRFCNKIYNAYKFIELIINDNNSLSCDKKSNISMVEDNISKDSIKKIDLKNNDQIDDNKGMNKFINSFVNITIDPKIPENSYSFFKNLSSHMKWILNKLNKTIEDQHKFIDIYNFMAASQSIYQLFFDFCDVVIECSKKENNMFCKFDINDNVSDNFDKNYKDFILYVFISILKLLNPYMPFITEDIHFKLINNCINDYPLILEMDFSNDFDHVLAVIKICRTNSKVLIVKDQFFDYFRILGKESVSFVDDLEDYESIGAIKYKIIN